MVAFRKPERRKTDRSLPSGTLLDRAILHVFPGWGSRRIAQRRLWALAERKYEALGRAYDAAEHDRTRGHGWMASRLSVDSILEEELETLRDRSRDLVRTDPFAAGALEGRLANDVGCGFRMQARVREYPGVVTKAQAKEINRTLERLWKVWSRLEQFWTKQRQVNRCWGTDGDVFVVFSDVGTADKPVPLHVEIVTASRVATPPEHAGNPRVRLGIEYDDEGNRVAYHIRTTEPYDSLRTEEVYRRVPAFDTNGRPRVVQVFDPAWPGQSRGVPWLTPAMTTLKDLKDWRETEIVGAQVAACFSVFVKTSNPHRTAIGAAADTDSHGQRIEEIEPGRVSYLSDADSIEFAQPNRPAGAFGPFMEWCLRAVATAINFPFELLTKTYKGTTYSAGRLSLIDGRIASKARQQINKDTWLDATWRHFVNECVILGLVPIDPQLYRDHREIFEAHQAIAHGWPWIDPTKEVQAARDAIDGKLQTLSDSLAERGLDLEEVLDQLQVEQEMMRERGLLPATPSAAVPGDDEVDEQAVEEDEAELVGAGAE